MKIGALFYIDDNISEEDLTFIDRYLPDVLKKEIQSLEAITEIFYSIPEGYDGRLKDNESFIRNDKDDVTFWKRFFSETQLDHAVKIYCDSPFMDINIIYEMIEVHTKYLAEFTYSENLPSGYSCEIVSKELLESLPESDEKMLPLGSVIRSNINQFDVELYYKAPDIRDKRLSFRSGDPREKQIMERIFSKFKRMPEYSNVKEIIDNNPDVLYLSPSFVEIELTGRCSLECIFCYRNTLKNTLPDMDMKIYKKILDEMRIFDLPYSVCFGGSGEPMMHDNFYEMLDLALNENIISNIIIETNGLFADDNYKNYLLNADDPRIVTIFNINGMDANSYTSLHGIDKFESVFQNIISVKDAVENDGRLYIQIMKINETEIFLDKYYDFWEKYNIPIILQKQNVYLGRIKDRRYSDLSPLERVPCWHLQRDLNILSDGRVTFCKQDIGGDYVRGSIKDQSIQDIWKESMSHFLDNYNNRYPINPDCKSCDEWYTFNL